DVLMIGVAMGDDQRLVAAEAKAHEDLVDCLVPLLGIEVVARGQAEAEMVDGLRGAGLLAGAGPHDLRRGLGLGDAVEVAIGDPCDAVRIGVDLGAARQVGDEPGEVLAESGPGASTGRGAALEADHSPGSAAPAASARRSAARGARISPPSSAAMAERTLGCRTRGA